ncbi:MAG: efflux RND transporter permease subunit, partial [bacterium]
MTFLYRHRFKTVCGAVLLFLLSAVSVVFIQKDFFKEDDISHFFVYITMPPGTSLEKTDEILKQYEKALLSRVGKGEITALLSTAGMQQLETEWLTESNLASITVDLVEDYERKRSVKEIMAETRNMLLEIPGADKIEVSTVNTGPPIEPPVKFKIFGDDYDQINEITQKLTARLKSCPDLYEIKNNVELKKKEMNIVVNESKASCYNLSVAEIGMDIRRAFEGVKAGIFRSGDDEVDIVVKYSDHHTKTPDDIRNMKFRNRLGVLVPFTNFAEIKEAVSVPVIKRLDQKRFSIVSAETEDKRKAAIVTAEIIEYFNKEIKPNYYNVSIEAGGEFEEFQEVFKQIIPLFMVGMALMYMILGMQFKSYAQPFIILFTVPFAFMGVVFYLVVFGQAFSFTVMYAVTALAGIAVNDAIVLISFINDIRSGKSDIVGKLPLAKAVVEAGALRLRPILLTSLTTIAGLIPMGIGISGKSNVWSPLANTIIFGLLMATFMTLFIIPCLYGVFMDMGSFLKLDKNNKKAVLLEKEELD